MAQRTIPLPSGHPLQAVQGLARQIALPHEFAPMRFPSFPALERTALMGFSAPATLTIPALTQIKVGLTRQAAYPAWAEQGFQSAAYFATYWGSGGDAGGSSVSETGAVPVAHLYEAGVGNQTGSVTRPGITFSNTTVPKPILGYDASSPGAPFIYVPSGWQYTVIVGRSVPFATADESFVCTIDRWVSPSEFVTSSVSGNRLQTKLSGAVGPSTMSGSCWIRPSTVEFATTTAHAMNGNFYAVIVITSGTTTFTDSATTLGSVVNSTSGTDTRGFLPLVYPVEFDNSTLPFYATRTTAASLLATNVSQVTKKGGTVLAGRVSPNVQDMWSVTAAYVTNLHPAEKAFMALETGHYTYCPPSTDLSSFWDYTSVTAPSSGFGPNVPSTAYPMVRLDNDSMYNVAFFKADADAESMAVTIDWHIEFRTSSALFPVGLSTMTLESLHQAQITLASVGYFFENPEHKAILASVVQAAKKYGPTALSMVPNPIVSGAGKLLMSRQPRPPPPTTSAAGSGLIPKKKPKRPPPSKKGKHGKPKPKRK